MSNIHDIATTIVILMPTVERYALRPYRRRRRRRARRPHKHTKTQQKKRVV